VLHQHGSQFGHQPGRVGVVENQRRPDLQGVVVGPGCRKQDTPLPQGVHDIEGERLVGQAVRVDQIDPDDPNP